MRLARSVKNKVLKLRLKAFDLRQYIRDVCFTLAQSHGNRLVEIAPALKRVDKIAVIAIRPAKDSRFSTLNFVRSLHENGYRILVGSDGAIDGEFKSSLDRLSIHYLVRRPVGRDFGVYKDACIALRERGLLEECDYLLLGNDSMFYPKSTKDLIEEAESNCETWACLFENFRDGYHAQSFFLLFGKPAFLHPRFLEFWASYQTYSSRVHAIKKGEIALSSTLVDAVGYPHCVFSSVKLRECLCHLETRSLIDLFSSLASIGNYGNLLAMSAYEPLERWNAAFGSMKLDLGQAVEESAYRSIIISALCRVAESSNPTHSLGLILNRLFEAPVKRDLVWRGIYPLADVVGEARGFGSEELSMMAADLRQRGLPASVQGFSRHLYNKGRI